MPRKKKMTAPIIVTVLTVCYYLLYFCLLITQLSGILRIALGVIPLALSVVMIKVCIERINEIKEGEEDDLGQY